MKCNSIRLNKFLAIALALLFVLSSTAFATDGSAAELEKDVSYDVPISEDSPSYSADDMSYDDEITEDNFSSLTEEEIPVDDTLDFNNAPSASISAVASNIISIDRSNIVMPRNSKKTVKYNI